MEILSSNELIDEYALKPENKHDYFIILSKLLNIHDNPIGYKEIFQHLILQLDFNIFITNYWEKKCLLFRRQCDKQSISLFNQIFSKDILLDIFNKNHIITTYNLKSFLYRLNNRVNIKLNDYILSKDIDSLFKQQCTCQFYQPQRYNDLLYVINSGFEYIFGSLAGASAYLTPSNSQGLAPHYDDIEAFIIQTEGSKTWNLWKGFIQLPDEYSNDFTRDQLVGDPITITLYPGDLLYLPRGTIHEAIAQSEFSTHITISLYQKYNVKSLLNETIVNKVDQVFKEELSLRSGLPIRLSDKLGSYTGSRNIDIDSSITVWRNDYLNEMKSILHNVVDKISINDLDISADNIVEDFVTNRLPPPDLTVDSNIIESSKSKKFDINTTVQLCDPRNIHICLKEIDGVNLICLANSRYNNRMKHMGHPLDNEIDDEEYNESDSEGDDNDDDSADDDDMKIWSMHLPHRMLPILQMLQSNYHSDGISYKNIEISMKTYNISLTEIRESIAQLEANGFVERLHNELNNNKDSKRNSNSRKKLRSK